MYLIYRKVSDNSFRASSLDWVFGKLRVVGSQVEAFQRPSLKNCYIALRLPSSNLGSVTKSGLTPRRVHGPFPPHCHSEWRPRETRDYLLYLSLSYLSMDMIALAPRGKFRHVVAICDRTGGFLWHDDVSFPLNYIRKFTIVSPFQPSKKISSLTPICRLKCRDEHW